ncbi:lytic transglycosylase domain-containing protein [Marinigracilibium pacificum]|uniref:Transglycosylase SLT domain-containing protein n=1 Tax=Marinigracilibium pacificum TaxID=2729599 RepID=A0A848J1P7_9BACT|nr:lytic transglycosylase domain-containing protein [Marinigracilibium pacificum]NMM47132.1 transglycosylase SLT domain-containing protein [Marinigracilibium pacificum]
MNTNKLLLTLNIFTVFTLLFYIVYSEFGKSPVVIENVDRTSSPSVFNANPGEPVVYSSKTVMIDLPDSLTFAGEKVPMDIPDVRERLDREIHINTYWHNNSIFLFKRANRWLPQIEEILKEKGVPDDFKYLCAIESGFQNVVSPAGAVGFWQFLKETGKEYGLEVDKQVDERYDPIKATYAACDYLLNAHEDLGNWTLVAASYNRGLSGVKRALENQKVDNYYDLMLNEETSRYVFRILACKELLQSPSDYGFEIKEEDLYSVIETKKVTVKETIPDLVEFALNQGINYKLLKAYNQWLRDDKLTVKEGEEYDIWIPVRK